MSDPRCTPSSIELPHTAANDPRIGQLLGRDLGSSHTPELVIVGFPCDQGVKINRGRTGAAEAPDAIRRALFRMTPDARCHDIFTQTISRTLDLGNVRVGADLGGNQALLGEIVAERIKAGSTVLVLGGGHETSFGHFLGYAGAGQRPKILNFDSHPDVRELVDGSPHSGSPFRQALLHESKACAGYAVFGLAPNSVARDHLEFMRSHDAAYVWNSELTITDVEREIVSAKTPLMTSIDLDVISQSRAPGVSAPAARGVELSLMLDVAEKLGSSSRVHSLDIVELNPTFDIDNQTARVAALLAWRFIVGVCRRKA